MCHTVIICVFFKRFLALHEGFSLTRLEYAAKSHCMTGIQHKVMDPGVTLEGIRELKCLLRTSRFLSSSFKISK